MSSPGSKIGIVALFLFVSIYKKGDVLITNETKNGEVWEVRTPM